MDELASHTAYSGVLCKTKQTDMLHYLIQTGKTFRIDTLYKQSKQAKQFVNKVIVSQVLTTFSN